MSTKLLPF